ncbi:hypothetical protein D3C71_2085970 [compost metagenome]
MPVQVVDPFEVVDIDHRHGQTALLAPGAVQFDGKTLKNRSTVEGARQHVAQRQVLQT